MSPSAAFPHGEIGVQMLGYVADIDAVPAEGRSSKDGYLASDVIGQSGVEAQYEKWLRGKSGKPGPAGRRLGDTVGTESETPPTPGDDVILNIDTGLRARRPEGAANQLVTLRATLSGATSGAVVVLDPQTGAVLAMVSLPTYNPEWWVGGMSTVHWNELNAPSAKDPLLNRTISGLYQPGSTFKLATATAALQDGLISPYSTISDPGYFDIPQPCSGICRYFNNEDESCGSCDVQTALTISDDVFFYTLGYDFFTDSDKSLQEGIQNEAGLYGFGQPTGVDLPDEYSGQVDGPQLREEQHAQNPIAFPNTGYYPG